MAQGFLSSTEGQNLDPESIGEKYFNDLADRSFFQDFSQRRDDDDDGSIICCKMHDIVHDFAQFLTETEFCVKQTSDKPLSNGSRKTRHLTLTFRDDDDEDEDDLSTFYASISEAKNLRSLVSVSAYFSNKNALSAEFFHHLRCLRVLNLESWGITYLSSETKELLHLRYLDLSYNESLNQLPDSVCSLYNLQTLKLTGCKRLYKLPTGIGKMTNLRHLDIRRTAVELSFLGGTGKFISTCLLVLTGSSEGYNTRELKDHNLLKGCVDISGLGRWKTAKEASKVKLLKEKQGICRNIDDGTMTMQSGMVEENLDALIVLQLHPNLKELTISNYPGSKLGNWVACLTRLRMLKLSNIQNYTHLPGLGSLPSLEELIVVNLRNLTRIGVEIYGNGCGEVVFPKLENLFICTDNLQEWDIAHGVQHARKVMPNVRSVVLKSKKLKVLPALWKLASLETLIIKGSAEVTHIGPLFYGICDTAVGEDRSVNQIAFPNLTLLRVEYMEGLEEFDLGVKLEGSSGVNQGREIIIMPRLRNMLIHECSKLKTLKVQSKLQSVEVLDLIKLDDLEAVQVMAPERGEDSIIVPLVLSLTVMSCPKLKSLQQLHLPKLIDLRIWNCFSLLQLPISPELTSLEISSSPLPQGLAGFEKLHHLCFYKCSFLNGIPESIRHLTRLQTLEIQKCDWPPEILEPEGINEDKEAWSIMSHIPKIIIEKSTYKLISELTPASC